jgi:hypothetical protein
MRSDSREAVGSQTIRTSVCKLCDNTVGKELYEDCFGMIADVAHFFAVKSIYMRNHNCTTSWGVAMIKSRHAVEPAEFSQSNFRACQAPNLHTPIGLLAILLYRKPGAAGQPKTSRFNGGVYVLVHPSESRHIGGE